LPALSVKKKTALIYMLACLWSCLKCFFFNLVDI